MKILLVFCLLFFLLIKPVFAEDPIISGNTVNLNTQYAFGNLFSFGGMISLIVPGAVTLFVVAVAFYLIIAGIKFIVSEGDKASISEAKKTITHTLIALFLFILLFLIVKYIPRFLNLGFQIIQ